MVEAGPGSGAGLVTGTPETTTLPAFDPTTPVVQGEFFGEPIVGGIREGVTPRIRAVERLLASQIGRFPIKDVGGYISRNIEGTNKPSQHNWSGIDINAPDFPKGAPRSVRHPDWFVDAMKRVGFGYGGDFSGTNDPHHYSLGPGERGRPGPIEVTFPAPPPRVIHGSAAHLINQMLPSNQQMRTIGKPPAPVMRSVGGAMGIQRPTFSGLR